MAMFCAVLRYLTQAAKGLLAIITHLSLVDSLTISQILSPSGLICVDSTLKLVLNGDKW